MALKIYCWVGLGLYGTLSINDYVLTHALLKTNGNAYESNPAAAMFLNRFGWQGLAVFKAVGVSVFIAAVILLLVRRRPAVGAGIVTFGCMVLFTVTTYTHRLIDEGPGRHRESWSRAESAPSGLRLPSHFQLPPNHRVAQN